MSGLSKEEKERIQKIVDDFKAKLKYVLLSSHKNYVDVKNVIDEVTEEYLK